MRIISQDGTVDVNYDDVWLIMINKSIYEEKHNGLNWERVVDEEGHYVVAEPKYCIHVNTAQDQFAIAIYSTPERALEVMAEIQSLYVYSQSPNRLECMNSSEFYKVNVYQMPTDKGDNE